MRLSTDPADPGFDHWRRLRLARKRPQVFLDGVELRCCFTADEEARTVVQAVLDERGMSVLDRATERVKRRTLHGDVRIVITDDT